MSGDIFTNHGTVSTYSGRIYCTVSCPNIPEKEYFELSFDLRGGGVPILFSGKNSVLVSYFLPKK